MVNERAFGKGAPLGDHLTGGLLTANEVSLIQTHFLYTLNNGGSLEDGLREVIALTFASPSAQWLCG